MIIFSGERCFFGWKWNRIHCWLRMSQVSPMWRGSWKINEFGKQKNSRVPKLCAVFLFQIESNLWPWGWHDQQQVEAKFVCMHTYSCRPDKVNFLPTPQYSGDLSHLATDRLRGLRNAKHKRVDAKDWFPPRGTRKCPERNFIATKREKNKRTNNRFYYKFQSVCILSPPSFVAEPDRRSLSACSWIARRKGKMPIPASSGNPKLRTKPPKRPVWSPWSKLDTAPLNCGELEKINQIDILE